MGTEFLTLTFIYCLALLSPGQDFFLIISSALRHGYSKAWWVCLGISIGNGVYIALAFIGHGWFQSDQAITFIRYAGALFLIYLGTLLLRAPNPSNATLETYSKKSLELFIQGMLSALLNPKNILFYFSILFTIVPTETALHVKLLYGTWMVFLVIVWDMTIAFIFGHTKAKRLLPLLHPLQKVIGALLIGFGVYELFS